jgi:hypothetical protein
MSDRTAACWTLIAPIAHLQVGKLTAKIDLGQPARGLHNVIIDGASLGDTSLLGADLSLASIEELSLPETYVRGNDLVAVYSATVNRPWRVQLYWRIADVAAAHAVVVELQVSINTGLLDAQPAVDVVSGLLGSDPEMNEGRVGTKLAAANFDYWQAVHPDDDATLSVDRIDGGMKIRERLFDRFLEKGVILRSRIRGALLPSGTTPDAIFQEFAAAPLPLTT